MARPPNNDDAPGDTRHQRKRLKGTLVGFRAPETETIEPREPAASFEAGKRLWGAQPGAAKGPPEKPSPFGGYVAGRSSPPPDVPAAPATEIMLDPDRAGEIDDDPLELEPATMPRDPPVRLLRSDPAPAIELPAARRYDGAVRPEPAGPVRMNKWTYRVVIFGGLLAAAALVAAGLTDEDLAPLLGLYVWIPLVPTLLVTCVFIYKMWSAIDDQRARTTPARAVALLFIPVFNLYWAFEIFPGFATDYNAYLERHRLSAPRLNQRLFIAALVPIVGLCVFFYLIGRVCEGVGALAPD